MLHRSSSRVTKWKMQNTISGGTKLLAETAGILSLRRIARCDSLTLRFVINLSIMILLLFAEGGNAVFNAVVIGGEL